MDSSKHEMLNQIIDRLPHFRESMRHFQRTYPPGATIPLWEIRDHLDDLREEFSHIHYNVLQYIDRYQHELNQQLDEQHDPIVNRS